MTINSFARYVLVGALVASLGCARNTGDMNEGTATGETTTADTAGFNVSPIDSVRTGVVEGNQRDTTAADTAKTDSLRIHRDSANVDPGAGWPQDSMQGGWSTPADSL